VHEFQAIDKKQIKFRARKLLAATNERYYNPHSVPRTDPIRSISPQGGFKMTNLLRFAVVSALVSLASYSSAAPVVFSGYTAGASTVSGSALTASNSFDAAIAGNGPGFYGFEGALPADLLSVTGSGSTASSCGGSAALFGFATEGTFFHCMAGGSVTFTFNIPIYAFGAYFTGVQLDQTLTFSDPAPQSLNFPSPSISQGGITFMGFTDYGGATAPCGQIRSVTYNAPGDIVGVDSVRWATSCTSGGPTVPEPATLALLAIGLAGIGALGRRKA